MNNKTLKKKIAEDTLKIIEQGYFIGSNGQHIDIKLAQENAISNTVVYSPKQSDELIQSRVISTLDTPTEIVVINESTLVATRRLLKEGHTDCLCLNFASAKKPGGGFLGGSQAQEESLARSTGLYPSLLQATDYYATNKKTKSCFYTDYMIYSPTVPIIKDDEGNCLNELLTTGIITAPAVNTGVVKNREPERMHEVEVVMKRRIEKVLAIALANNHLSLVLGAWGCGVFQNEPDNIANYFKDVLDTQFKNQFRKVVFAIYSPKNKSFKFFDKVFNQ